MRLTLSGDSQLDFRIKQFCSHRTGQAALPALRSFPLWCRVVSRWLLSWAGAGVTVKHVWSPYLQSITHLLNSFWCPRSPGKCCLWGKEGNGHHCGVQESLCAHFSLSPVQNCWGGHCSWQELTQGVTNGSKVTGIWYWFLQVITDHKNFNIVLFVTPFKCFNVV